MFSRLAPPLLCAALACAGLPLTAIAAPNPADTPAVLTVRQFVAARAAGDSGTAYGLLSFPSPKNAAAKDYAAGTGFSGTATPAEKAMPLYAVLALLLDTHNTAHYAFAVIGPDPADANTVLVRATPPASLKSVAAATVRVVTVATPSGTAHIDTLKSVERTDPKQFAQVMARARERAKQVISQSNLKQLSLGIIQYEQDHDEMMPDAAKWVDKIMPYVRDKALFHDPSAPASEAYSYAYNRTLSHQTLAVLYAPASTVMLFESTKGVKNAADTGQSVPRPGRHLGGTDYAFADGHVKWFPDGTKLSYKLTGK